MTTSHVRAGGSLNYVGMRSKDWLQRAQSTNGSLRDDLALALDGVAIAEEFCAILSCSFDSIVEHMSKLPSKQDPFLAILHVFEKLIAQKCKQIENDNSRYTARSRSRYAVRLLEVIATLSRSRDLKTLRALSPELSAIAPAPEKGDDSLASIGATQSAALEPIDALGLTKPIDHVPSSDEIFRNSLSTGDPLGEISDSHMWVPDNWGINLDRLRRLTGNLLGYARTRRDIEHSFEAATPQFITIDYTSSSEYHFLNDDRSFDASASSPLGSGGGSLTSDTATAPTLQHFLRARWGTESMIDTALDEAALRKTVASVKRRRVLFTQLDYTPTYSYGISRKIEEAIKAGKSAIISGISGTGKSTLLANVLPDDVAIFELGGDSDLKSARHAVFKIHDFECMMRRARRVKGRKLLVCHEFFIGPDQLTQLGIFDQIVFAGDPRQPGAFATSQPLYEFVKAIGGQAFNLPVVWRASNPLSMMTVNYFAYGSRYKICSRRYEGTPGFQFTLMECDDSAIHIASCMFTYALQVVREGRSVIVAVGSNELASYLDALMARLPVIPSKLRCHYLADIQGREADVLVVDLHDVATAIPRADDAMRFFIMMLGRARLTTCFALGKRNMARDRESTLPIEVFTGVLLRHRVRSRETRTVEKPGSQFHQLTKVVRLVPIDEETIAAFSVKTDYADIILVKSGASHNASTLRNTFCTIEAPSFFENDADVAEESEILLELLLLAKFPMKRIFSFHDIRNFIKLSRGEAPCDSPG